MSTLRGSVSAVCSAHDFFVGPPHLGATAKSDFNMHDGGESAVTEPSAMALGKRPCFLLGPQSPKPESEKFEVHHESVLEQAPRLERHVSASVDAALS